MVHSIIFISHKLKEVMEISDRITVLRHGKRVGTTKVADTSPTRLAKQMVGHEFAGNSEKCPSPWFSNP